MLHEKTTKTDQHDSDIQIVRNCYYHVSGNDGGKGMPGGLNE